MGAAPGQRVRDHRRRFDTQRQACARALSPEARHALPGMLDALRALALASAETAGRQHTWMMHADWRITAVYAGHFRRAVRTTAALATPEPSAHARETSRPQCVR